MAHASNTTENSHGLSDRRLHSREKIGSVIYIELASGNGGIILNLSEGGFAVQAAMPLIDDHFPSLRFRFSKSESWIQEKGVIAWKSKSKKMAGVKFVDLSEKSRTQISRWLSLEASGDKNLRDSGTPLPLAPPQNASTCDDGKSLVKEIPTHDPDAKNQYRNSMPPNGATALHSSNAPMDSMPENDMRSTLGAPVQAPQGSRELESWHSRRASRPRSLLKRYLVDERHRIRLFDLVSEEVEKLCSELTEPKFPTNVPVTDEEFIRRVHRYEELTEELVSIIIIGCFWGEKNQELIWVKLLERVANAGGPLSGHHQWVSLQSYPALLLFYAGGIAAIANEKYATLEALCVKPRLIGPNGDCRLLDRLSAATVIEDERLSQILIGGGVSAAPSSAYLCSLLRDRFQDLVPSDQVYDEIFDRFEYLFALMWIDESPIGAILDRVPLGRFAWRDLSVLKGDPCIEAQIGAEVSREGKDWPVFRAGIFGASMQRFLSARNRVATFIGSKPHRTR
jgi:hypothetical protein